MQQPEELAIYVKYDLENGNKYLLCIDIFQQYYLNIQRMKVSRILILFCLLGNVFSLWFSPHLTIYYAGNLGQFKQNFQEIPKTNTGRKEKQLGFKRMNPENPLGNCFFRTRYSGIPYVRCLKIAKRFAFERLNRK